MTVKSLHKSTNHNVLNTHVKRMSVKDIAGRAMGSTPAVRALFVAGFVAALVGVGVISVNFSDFAVGAKKGKERRAELSDVDPVQLLTEYTRYMAEETAIARKLNQDTSFRKKHNAKLQLRAGRIAAKFNTQNDLVSDLVDYNPAGLSEARTQSVERKCLAQAIYFEARSEERVGQLAVADVVLNRVASRFYPDTICDVVFQGTERDTGCQFSFTCDGSMDKVTLGPKNRLWRNADDLAGSILAGLHVPVSREATHYHADYVDPVWAATLSPTATIGTHKFYRFKNSKIEFAAPAGM